MREDPACLHDPHKGQLERVEGGRGEPRLALVNEERIEPRVRLGRDDAGKEEGAERRACVVRMSVSQSNNIEKHTDLPHLFVEKAAKHRCRELSTRIWPNNYYGQFVGARYCRELASVTLFLC